MDHMEPQPTAKQAALLATDAPEVTLASLVERFVRHLPLFVSLMLVGMGLGILSFKSQPVAFEAVAMLELDPHVNHPLGEKAESAIHYTPSGDSFDTQEFYNTQYAIITSDRVLTAAAQDLAIARDYDFFGMTHAPATPPSLDDAAEAIRAHLRVNPIKTSRLVQIIIRDKNAARAAKICDAVARTYIDQNREIAVAATSEAVVWLNTQIDSVNRDLEQKEDALHAFKQKHNLPSTSINEESNGLRLQMQVFNEALAKTQTRRQELVAKKSELAKISADNVDELPPSLQSEVLTLRRAELMLAERDRDALVNLGKGNEHPLVTQANARLVQAKKRYVDEIRNVRASVDRELAVIERQEQGESSLFAGSRHEAIDLGMMEIEYRRLERATSNDEALLKVLTERSKDADMARMVKLNNVFLVDAAKVPRAPIMNSLVKYLSQGILGGLIVGMMLAWVRERLDVSIRSVEDVGSKLGLIVVGILPRIAGERTGRALRRGRPKIDAPSIEHLAHDRPLGAMAEAVRALRTNLTFVNIDKPYRTLLVTSSVAGEGKTTVASNVAIALAQSSERVCIVDCDLRRPRLNHVFDRVGDPGMTNLLLGEVTLEEVTKPTRVPNLFCIPAGPSPPNWADVLHTERLKLILAELKTRFDRVIIDSPPLVAVTDAAVLSTLVDGTILVVRSASTTRAIGVRALRSLANVDAVVIGAVLNAVDMSKQGYGHYYQEGYARIETDSEGLSIPPAAEGVEGG
jgi:succinoglycan biosynthesis transport protein ExoP